MEARSARLLLQLLMLVWKLITHLVFLVDDLQVRSRRGEQARLEQHGVCMEQASQQKQGNTAMNPAHLVQLRGVQVVRHACLCSLYFVCSKWKRAKQSNVKEPDSRARLFSFRQSGIYTSSQPRIINTASSMAPRRRAHQSDNARPAAGLVDRRSTVARPAQSDDEDDE